LIWFAHSIESLSLPLSYTIIYENEMQTSDAHSDYEWGNLILSEENNGILCAAASIMLMHSFSLALADLCMRHWTPVKPPYIRDDKD